MFSWSGIRIGKLHLEMQQDEQSYQVESKLKTAGLVAMFSDHKSLTRVDGKRIEDEFRPVSYRSDYHSGQKDKLIALNYDETGNIIHEEISPPKRLNRPDVPSSLKSGVADSLTAIFAMREQIKQAVDSGSKEIIVPVFDGKRRFDLQARIINPDTSLKMNKRSIPAIKLGLKRTPIAGFKDKELKKIGKGEPELEFFVDQENLTLLGLQLPLYGGTVMAWVKDACVNDGCVLKDQQLAAR